MTFRSRPLGARSQTIAAAFIVLLLAMVLALPALANSAWTDTGNLAEGRAEHQAVRLDDGRVLVVGGRLWTNAAVTAEVYDSASGTWTATGPRNFTSVKSSVTLLADGRVLVAGTDGGYSGSFAHAEIYDPATNAWSWTGSMTQARSGHLAVRLNDGRVLVAGSQWATKTAEIYDPATGTWSVTGSMNIDHGNGTASLLPDGRVLVAGGGLDPFGGGQITAAAEIFDPATGAWQFTGSMITARRLHTATPLADGRILVAGGLNANNGWLASAEVYDPATGQWSSAGNLSNARYNHTTTLLADGQVLVAGMPDVSGASPLSAEVYDPAGNTWFSTTDLPATRWSHSATLLGNGSVLLAGGLSSDPTALELASAILYGPGDGTPPPPPPTPEPSISLHVGDLDGSSASVNNRNWQATVTILVLDSNGAPIADATVGGSWSGGITGSAFCTTDGNGTCSVTSGNVRTNKSSVTFTVSSVSHGSLFYDAAANADLDGESNGTAITVSRP